MSKIIDLTGQKFGRLTVIEKLKGDKHGDLMWLCKCDCGDEKIVKSSSLRKGATQSCGCLHKEIISLTHKKYNTYDLAGEFGIGYTLKDEPFYFDLGDYNKIKDFCWLKDKDGYMISRQEDNTIIRMHRLVMNCPDGMEVDHIYHNLYDNRKNELRIVTSSQNSMNMTIPQHNTSGVKGVNWDNEKEKWQAYISKNRKRIHLGYYDNIEDARDARKQAEEKYFGEYNYKEKIDSL